MCPVQNSDILKQRQGKQREFYKGGKPMLRVSRAKKEADDFAYTKDVVDFFINSTRFQDQSSQNNSSGRDLYKLYEAYNARIPESEFHYVTNPLNSSKGELTNYPARIRSYSIIRPNIDLILGEYEKRPRGHTVVVKNGDEINTMLDQMNYEIKSSLEQLFVNELNRRGMDTGVESQPVEPPLAIKARYQEKWQDTRSIMGQAMLEKLREEQDVREKENEMFLDWNITGEAYSYKNIIQGDFVYERVSPLDIDYDKSPHVRFIEDGSWVVRRMFMTPSDIVTRFWDQITDDDIDAMEEQDSSMPFTSTYFNNLFGSSYRTDEDMRRSKIPVYHTCWKYYKKIGFCSYFDEFGESQSFEVPEGYVADKELGEVVEWFWVPEWWECYRADLPQAGGTSDQSTDGVYFNIGPVPVQRNMMNNPAYCKCPYNGMRFSDTHSRNVSLVELGLPYEIMYIILHYRMEMTIAKNKGKIMLIDHAVLPQTDGWTIDKAFYYADSMSMLPINRQQDGVDRSYNQYQVMDLDLYKHIQNLVDVIRYIKEEWDQLIGITPQRKGQITSSETATATNAARYQSSVISERLFTKFEEFMRREHQGILDLSKFINLDNYKSIFFSDDTRRQMVTINPEDFKETEYGLYVSSSPQDMDDLNTLRSLMPNMVANMSPELVVESITSRNISKLRRVLAEKKEMEIQQAEQMKASEAERTKQLEEIKGRYMTMEKEFDMQMLDLEYDRKEGIEHIKGQYGLADTNTPGDALDPIKAQEASLKAEDLRTKHTELQEKLKIQKTKNQIEEKKIEKDAETKRYVSDNQLKIAKENKNRYDKK